MQFGTRSSTLIGRGSSKPNLTLQDLSELPDQLRGAYVVIGNFDGVHRGHELLIRRAANLAKIDAARLVAITFDPHPRSFLEPHQPFLQLTDSDEKASLLRQAGVDEVVTLNFDSCLASLSAETFLEQVLVKHFEAKGLLASRNFRFGHNRTGEAAELATVGPGLGLLVELVPPLIEHDTDELISATGIRAKLACGEISAANRMLGRRWSVKGEVAHGDKRGRELGFPTANILTDSNFRFAFGIYAVRVRLDDTIAEGVACYGTRPQFDDGAPRLEVHILNFNDNIYGKRMVVEFVAFLRRERTFVSVDALKEQINRDCVLARAHIEANHELSSLDPSFLLRRPPETPGSSSIR